MDIIRGRAAQHNPTKLAAHNFTGTVWIDPIVPLTKEGHLVVSVTFSPGARTHWHSHAEGQFLIVTSGVGWVCAHGGSPQAIRAGDVVWTPPGERHWHGATPSTVMTHTAVSLGRPQWLREVTQSEYTPGPDQEIS
jgi:quercetin dioxygenase-like cupin family protein